ncbi:MAG: sigma-54-dependent Fis family transcriptional regulator [Polyangiaceae bacterium]|nr:sigma-54-dependent Fis family transcriptional regulator [Polyangiaceae bacterium]
MPNATPLILVEPDAALADLLERVAKQRGYTARRVATLADARAALEDTPAGVLITELNLPDGDGFALLELAQRIDPRTLVIAITATGSIELAVRAVKLGAYDFLSKPLDPEVFGAALIRVTEARRLRAEVARLRGELDTARGAMGLIGKSQALADIAALIERVADSPATVLVTGPTGSGKERIARALHEASRRRQEPFVAVNAASIPEQLLESELFGYVRGAFTDAKNDKQGLFVEADRGTLFLDEIGDFPIHLQAKLLRILQDQEVRPVGATKARRVDVRIVTATHHNLRQLVKEKRFREDLFYRLAVIEVNVPPLRDRPEDVLPLAEFFLERAAKRAHRDIVGFSQAAARRLVDHAWPGNVRELENAVERAVAFARDRYIGEDDLPPSLIETAPRDIFATAAERLMTLEELQRGYVKHVLERLGGNKVRAAAALGVHRRTIQRWVGEENEGDSDKPEKD